MPGTRGARFALFAMLLVMACRLERKVPPESGPEPPRPVGLTADGGVDRARVLAVGRAQAYDANPGASHRALLEDGIEATVEPQEGSYRNPKDGFDRGVVVARFINHSDASLARLGLQPRGTTYWFIYRKEGQLVSALIPDTESGKFDVLDVPTVLHPPTRSWRQSVAQWQLPGILDQSRGMGALGVSAAAGQIPWTVCLEYGCCKLGQ